MQPHARPHARPPRTPPPCRACLPAPSAHTETARADWLTARQHQGTPSRPPPRALRGTCVCASVAVLSKCAAQTACGAVCVCTCTVRPQQKPPQCAQHPTPARRKHFETPSCAHMSAVTTRWPPSSGSAFFLSCDVLQGVLQDVCIGCSMGGQEPATSQRVLLGQLLFRASRAARARCPAAPFFQWPPTHKEVVKVRLVLLAVHVLQDLEPLLVVCFGDGEGVRPRGRT